MIMADRIPGMTDLELQTLQANAERLQHVGTPASMAAAAELLPLVTAEIAQRKAAKPAPVRKTPVRKTAAKKTAAKKTATA